MDVIFDTNPYRYLAKDRTYGQTLDLVQAIRKAEREHDKVAWAAPTVWLELFNHILDPTDPHSADCIGATVASYAHTRVFGSGRFYRLAPRADMVAAETLFDHTDEGENNILRELDRVAGVVFYDPVIEAVEKERPQVEIFNNFLRKEENGFMQRFTEGAATYKQHYSGEADVVQNLRKPQVLRNMYRGFAKMQGVQIGRDLNWIDANIETLADQVEKFMPAPFQLYIAIAARLVGNPDMDIYKKSRRNWYWDYQMLFYISRSAMTLVTDDGDMKKAAVAAGIGNKVMTLAEYMGELWVAM